MYAASSWVGATVLAIVSCWIPSTSATKVPTNKEVQIASSTQQSHVCEVSSGEPARWISQEMPAETLKNSILRVVTERPSLDDVDIAAQLGEEPFEVSRMLRTMEAEGLVVRA